MDYKEILYMFFIKALAEWDGMDGATKLFYGNFEKYLEYVCELNDMDYNEIADEIDEMLDV
jgi:hypothetical protein